MCNGDNHHCPDWRHHLKLKKDQAIRSAKKAAKRKADRAAAKASRRPAEQCASCDGDDGDSAGRSAGRTVKPKRHFGDEPEETEQQKRVRLEEQLKETIEQLKVARAAAEATAVKENLATKAEQSRHRRMFGGPCTEATQQLYAAFEIDEHGLPRNKAAAERMAQREVAKVVGPLGALSTDQQAAVLTAAIKRPALREAANLAGIGQASFSERIVDRVKAAFASQGIKRGSLGADVEASVDSFLNLAAPTPNEEVMQRGKHAKKQKAAGGEAKVAAVVGAREWASELGLSLTTAWRRLKGAIERRAKLDEGEEDAYWTYYRERVGHGIDEETRKLVLDFYIGHPSIKRSPMKSDTLQMKDANGEKVLVAKLLSEVSLTDVFIDFEKKHPGLLKERAFRELRPPELRRMSRRQLDMCGCRWCIEMRLFQDALNAERAVLAIKHAAAPYTAPYTHDKPRAAAADATCGMVSNAAGACLGHAALRYASPPARGTEEGGWSKTYFSNSILQKLPYNAYHHLTLGSLDPTLASARRCTLGLCDKCGTAKMKTHPLEEDTSATAHMMRYHYYDTIETQTSYNTTSKHIKLVKSNPVPMGEFMKLYREKLAYYTYHAGMVRLTTAIRIERMGISPGDAALIIDYSEKLNKERNKKPQSQHWETTSMTIEVAVAEAWRLELDAAEVARIAARLLTAKGDERGKVLEEEKALGKRVYYHCSDYKPQVAAVTTHNMEIMLKEMLALGELKEGARGSGKGKGGTVWLKMDGCAKQYKCSKAMYLMCQLALRLDLTLDQMNEVTGHGKDEADGHGGVFKTWLTSKMLASDIVSGEIEAADVVDGELASFADKMCEVARQGLSELKPQQMNSKRARLSNLLQRVFKTYTEADICTPPEMAAMTAALSTGVPASMDSRMKATLAHNNYRADPELQREGQNKVIAARRLACACAGCRAHLQLPIANRYEPHDDCAWAAIFERLNDWKLVELKPVGEEGAAQQEEDDAMQLQDRTDDMAARCAPGEFLATRGKGEHAPDGYYVLRATSAPYELDETTTLHELLDDDGKPIVVEKGATVVDAVYLNKVPGGRELSGWYTPFALGDARGNVRVPTHMVLMAGFSMPAGTNVPGAKKWVDPTGRDPAYPGGPLSAKDKKAQGAWGLKFMRVDAVEKGAVVLPAETHASIMDELDTRAAARE